MNDAIYLTILFLIVTALVLSMNPTKSQSRWCASDDNNANTDSQMNIHTINKTPIRPELQYEPKESMKSSLKRPRYISMNKAHNFAAKIVDNAYTNKPYPHIEQQPIQAHRKNNNCQLPHHRKHIPKRQKLKTIHTMNVNATGTKRGSNSVSPSPNASKKQKEKDNEKEKTKDITMKETNNNKTKAARFNTTIEEIPDKDKDLFVSTAVNIHKVDISEKIPKEIRAQAIKPYKCFYGEPSNKDAAQKDIEKLMRVIAQIIKDDRDWNELNNTPTGFDLDTWVLTTQKILSVDEEEEDGIDEDTRAQARIIVSRLSFTPPTKLFGSNISKSQTPASRASFAWYAAKTNIGSNYSKGAVQTTITQFQASKKTSKIATIPNHNQSNKTTKTQTGSKNNEDINPKQTVGSKTISSTSNRVTPSQDKTNKGKDNDTQDYMEIDEEDDEPQILKQTKLFRPRDDRVRIVLKLPVATVKGKSTIEVLLGHIKDIFEAATKHDDQIQILPWDLQGAEEDVRLIEQGTAFPKTKKDFELYTDYLRPKANNTNWIKMHWACDSNVHFIVTSMECPIQYIYEGKKAGAYPVAVQDSPRAVDVCDLLYTSGCNDTEHLLQLIREEGSKYCQQALKQQTFKVGARIKACRELKSNEEVKRMHWALDETKMIHIEADKAQAKILLQYLKIAFSKDNRLERLGSMSARVLPDKAFVKTGSRGLKQRTIMLKKHQAVIRSLRLISTEDVKELDKITTVNNHKYTLRNILMELTFPLVSEESSKFLIHSVDFVQSGREAGWVYITAYHDRADLAASLLDVLPAYIQYKLGHEAVREWFHPQAIGIANDVEFETDNDGNWLGTWTTDEDLQVQQVIEEDMGITLQIDGINLIEGQDPVLLTADDASMKSLAPNFRSISGLGEAQNNDNANDKSKQLEDLESPTALKGTAAVENSGGDSM